MIYHSSLGVNMIDSGPNGGQEIPLGRTQFNGYGPGGLSQHFIQRGAYLSPAPFVRLSSTWSMPKLPAFWRGGNSLNVARNFPTYCCAGTSRKACSTR